MPLVSPFFQFPTLPSQHPIPARRYTQRFQSTENLIASQPWLNLY